MSLPRRSAIFSRDPAEHQGLDDDGVPVVDLTGVDDVQCSSVVLRMAFLTSFRVVARQFIVSAPLSAPVAMQSGLKVQLATHCLQNLQIIRNQRDPTFQQPSNVCQRLIHNQTEIWWIDEKLIAAHIHGRRQRCATEQFDCRK